MTGSHQRPSARLRRSRPISTRACLLTGTALAGLNVLTLLVDPAMAQTLPQTPLQTLPPPSSGTAGGTLGIDCEAPRRTAEGKLILGDFRHERMMCEADRSTALHYAHLVESTHARLHLAFGQLPEPLRQNLLAHMRTNDDLGAWRYSDSAMLARLEAYDAGIGAHAARWKDGIPGVPAKELKRFDWRIGAPVAADWHRHIRARTCGPDDGTVLVWLDPEAVRDRWTARMVQRTVRAWLDRETDRSGSTSRIPGVVTGETLRALTGPDGRVKDLPDCSNTVPEGALAMRLYVGRLPEMGMKDVANCPPEQVGYRRYAWARRGGVFLVPLLESNIGGVIGPLLNRGAPLLGQPVPGQAALPLATYVPEDDAPPWDETAAFADQHKAWHLIVDTCRVPGTRDIGRTETCDGSLNGKPVQGSVVRTYRSRERADPTDPFKIVWWPVGPDGGAKQGRTSGDLGVDVSAGETHPIWTETVLFCTSDAIPETRAPTVPEPEEATFPFPTCAEHWGGRYSEGGRTGYSQSVSYPEGWPVRGVEIRRIDDDCFKWDLQSGAHTETRAGPRCPAGHTGSVTEARVTRYEWWNRLFAITRGRDAGPTHAKWQRSLPDSATLEEARSHHGAGNADGPSGAYDQVMRRVIKDWHTSAITCRPQNSGGDGDSDDGSWDVDGDGRGDYASKADAEKAGHSGGSKVGDTCGSCNGPGDGGPGESSGGGDSSGGGGCFLTTAIVARRGEADDGPTLSTLRAFRDGWMRDHPEGARLIAEYYAQAPAIVAAIPPDHADWDWIEAKVDKAVREITTGQPEAAFETYCAMVRRLTRAWLGREEAGALSLPIERAIPGAQLEEITV